MQNVVDPDCAHCALKQSALEWHIDPRPPLLDTHAPDVPCRMHVNIAGQLVATAGSHVELQAPLTQMREAQSVPTLHASPICPVIWQLPQLAVLPT